MDGLFQPMHLMVILVIVLIIFGPRRLPELGEGLGKSIKAFKQAMDQKDAPDETTRSLSQSDKRDRPQV